VEGQEEEKMAVLAHESFNAFLITCRNKEIIMRIKIYRSIIIIFLLVFSIGNLISTTITIEGRRTLFIVEAILLVGFMILDSLDKMNE